MERCLPRDGYKLVKRMFARFVQISIKNLSDLTFKNFSSTHRIYIYRTTSSPFLPFFFLSVFYAYGAKCDRTNYKFFFWALPYFPPFSRFFVLSLSQSLPPPLEPFLSEVTLAISVRSPFSGHQPLCSARSSIALLSLRGSLPPFLLRIVSSSRLKNTPLKNHGTGRRFYDRKLRWHN